MDKYEYNVKSDQIKKLYSRKEFEAAAKIADEIDWYRVKDNTMINRVADIYENTKQYEKAKEVLLIAYERSPLGRQLAYKLTILALRTKNFVEADEFYQDFVEMSPSDVSQYLLKYRIAKAKGEDVEILIKILEAYVDVEMDERWQYELAKLYHEAGQDDKCVAMCDELDLWFNDGKYVDKARELKKLITGMMSEYNKRYADVNNSKAVFTNSVENISANLSDTGLNENAADTLESNDSIDTAVNGEEKEDEDRIGIRSLAEAIVASKEEREAARAAEIATMEEESEENLEPLDDSLSEDEEYLDDEISPEDEAKAVAEAAAKEVARRAKEAEKTIPEETPEAKMANEALKAAEAAAMEAQKAADLAKQLVMEAKLRAEQIKSAQSGEPDRFKDMSAEEISKALEEEDILKGNVSPKRKDSMIEIYEFDKSKEGKGTNIGDELTKTAEIDIDEINIRLADTENLYNTANIQAALAKSMEKLLDDEKKRVRNAFEMQIDDEDNEIKPIENAEDDSYLDDTQEKIETEKINEIEDSVEAEKINEIEDSVEAEKIDEIEDSVETEINVEKQQEQIHNIEPEITANEDISIELEAVGEPEDEVKLKEEAKSEVEITSEDKEEAESEVEITSEDKDEAKSEVEIASEDKEEIEAESEIEAKSEAEPEVEAKSEFEEQSEVNAEPEADVETEPADDEEADDFYLDDDEAANEPTKRIDRAEINRLLNAGNSIYQKAPMSPFDISETDGLEDSKSAEEDEQIKGQMTIDEVLAEYEKIEAEKEAEREAVKEAEPFEDIDTEDDVEELEEYSDTDNNSELNIQDDSVPGEDDTELETSEENELDGKSKFINKNHKIPEDYRSLFNDFVGTGSMEEKIADTLDNLINKFTMDGTSKTNNVIITGSAKIGKTTLGLSIIKAANHGRNRSGRKVAKVKASALNKRGVALAMTQILGTDLIIEQAGNLMPNTIVDLMIAMKNYTEEMLIVLEDDKAAIDRMLENAPDMAKFFTNRLDIQEMEIDDMVKIAKEYAEEQFYEIDDMGELALYAKLDDISGRNPVLSIEDIQEVIDDAIIHANRFSIGKLFGRRRKGKNEMGTLTEQDFM